MPASIGVNLRVTGHCRQGGRKYMEDFFSVAYQQTEDEKDLEYAFFGIYDGHGGAEAAAFAKEHLMETIIKHKNFWSDYDDDVLRAIKDGYVATHYAMWKEQEKWPKTASGLPSTAGTTASVAFIRRGKIYIGHVGDSGIILGYQDPGCPEWKAKPLTRDHKPENVDEMTRITRCGGKVVSKSGVPRVVWNRPKIGHQGPVRRSTPIDEIPFLAVARSLGDLWSYNSQINEFIVSPDPDCSVIKIDTNIHRCLVFGTDGLYNMLSPSMAIRIVQQAERHNENAALSDSTYKTWMNPSKLLVEKALERWHSTKMRADNTSVVTLMLDPPGPPRAQVLKDRKKNLPERGLKILTRFEDEQERPKEANPGISTPTEELSSGGEVAQTSMESDLQSTPTIPSCSSTVTSQSLEEVLKKVNFETASENVSVSSSDLIMNYPLKERNFVPKLRESTSFDPREPIPKSLISDNEKENQKSAQHMDDDNTIQCNEVSSSSIELDSTCLDEEEVGPSTKVEKHNLRSSRKVDNDKNSSEKNIKVSKRKRESEDGPLLRKSIRIDQNQKKAVETGEKSINISETEDKSKKIVEKRDQTKRLCNNLTSKGSINPKHKSSKPEELKKPVAKGLKIAEIGKTRSGESKAGASRSGTLKKNLRSLIVPSEETATTTINSVQRVSSTKPLPNKKKKKRTKIFGKRFQQRSRMLKIIKKKK